MIHYTNIILACIIIFLLLKKYTLKEGHIDIGDGRVPNVPNDVVCMILYAMGVEIDRWEYLENKCLSKTNDLNKDENGNVCRA